MCLFRCKCGCFFSVKEITHSYPRCPNCDNHVSISYYSDIREINNALKGSGMTMQMIPDDATVKISFDL